MIITENIITVVRPGEKNHYTTVPFPALLQYEVDITILPPACYEFFLYV